MATYNVGFKINDVLLEVSFVRDLCLAGYEARKLSKSAWFVEAVNEEWLARIQKISDKYWYF